MASRQNGALPMIRSLRFASYTALSACASCSEEEPSAFRVGNALYHFPTGQVDFVLDDGALPPTYVHIDTPPTPDKEDVDFLRFVSNTEDGRPTRTSVMLNYHGKLGSPLSRFLSREIKVFHKPWGTVFCDAKATKVDLRFPCGIEITDRGADWEVLLDYSRLAEEVDMAAEGKRILAAYRLGRSQR